MLVELLLDESKWLPFAMLVAFGAALAAIGRARRAGSARRSQVQAGLNVFHGSMIGVMGCGHLLAVSIKSARGALEGSLAILVLYGLVLVVPAGWLAFGGARLARGERRTANVVACAWLAFSLLALGLHNLPLAAPAGLGVAYLFHSRPAVGRSIVAVAIVSSLALFAAAVVFAASGQSFEQFRGTSVSALGPTSDTARRPR